MRSIVLFTTIVAMTGLFSCSPQQRQDAENSADSLLQGIEEEAGTLENELDTIFDEADTAAGKLKKGAEDATQKAKDEAEKAADKIGQQPEQ